jgi:high-affinity iron transporter
MLRRFALALLLCLPLGAFAQEAQTILHLLDYIGVDYPEAIEAGKVKNADEYQEMLEFTAQVTRRIGLLPDNPLKKNLLLEAIGLEQLVKQKAEPPAVAAASSKLRRTIVEAYQLRLAPRAAPDLTKGKALYKQLCVACHGVEGDGNGPAAKGLEPPPSSFHDLGRMAQRSVYGLYNTITLGVEGTSMASFKQLPEHERWALAFYVANLGVPEARVRAGDALWQAGTARQAFADLGPVATLSTEEVMERHGEQAARVQDYLRAHPEALRQSPIAFARQKLADAAQAYAKGDHIAAREAAITGYLEGFELVEAGLANVDPNLMREIERHMLGLRASIEEQPSAAQIDKQVGEIDALLAAAQHKLDTDGLSRTTAFTASLIILLREGLEAILVLAAIIAFVIKTGRKDALPWVHAGWIAALALGAVTWVAATFLIEISGANRELTEGVTALLAAAVLLYVGYWLHSKAYAQSWNRFIREHVGQALAKRTLWALAAVSFLAVYREMFEIVLFYQALWVQAGESGQAAVLGGMGAAALALAVIGFALLKYSVRLPIRPFFVATSALLAILAVVFTGHGIAALQEAGLIGVTALNFGPLPLLGIYPSGESMSAQLLIVCVIGLGYWMARRSTGERLPYDGYGGS